MLKEHVATSHYQVRDGGDDEEGGVADDADDVGRVEAHVARQLRFERRVQHFN